MAYSKYQRFLTKKPDHCKQSEQTCKGCELHAGRCIAQEAELAKDRKQDERENQD